MREFELDARLALCADFVREGRVLADVGTDHGYLPIRLLLDQRIPSAFAADIRPGPLSAAKENARMNGLSNCTFWAGDVLKVIDELGEVPDLIVLDPPRDGVNPKALEKIIRFGVEKMVYIACKPTSLARDLEMLQGRGYQVERMGCVDLFPGTYHVETVVRLQRKHT